MSTVTFTQSQMKDILSIASEYNIPLAIVQQTAMEIFKTNVNSNNVKPCTVNKSWANMVKSNQPKLNVNNNNSASAPKIKIHNNSHLPTYNHKISWGDSLV
jgi:spore coat protein CotF